jgi:hypothetical protein
MGEKFNLKYKVLHLAGDVSHDELQAKYKRLNNASE